MRDLDANLSPMAVAVRSGSKLWKVHSTPLPLAAATMSNIPPLARTGRLMRAETLSVIRVQRRQKKKLETCPARWDRRLGRHRWRPTAMAPNETLLLRLQCPVRRERDRESVRERDTEIVGRVGEENG
jgi:hypothetical protein